MDHKFQINLRGLIDLLSNHLYSGPEVYARELLQNGVDAIRARTYLEPDHLGEIVIDVHSPAGKPPVLVFTDNGVGLNEDEIHRFLATIGESSKKKDNWDRPTDFIGQFGIGLLSCFVVSDEIVVVTRSIKEADAPALEWRGRPDGTYTIRKLEAGALAGTQVYLTCKKGCEEHFEPARVKELAKHYGGLLPFPIRVNSGRESEIVNADGAPWRAKYPNEKARARALLQFGETIFGMKFFDAIPLRSSAGSVEGVAFVLPFTPSLATKRTHRVYLKNMLLSEEADNLLPDWTFFVKAVVNANDLRPTASRESFYEDEKLEAARVTLGECLKAYLIELSQKDTKKLTQLIELHSLSIKALAVQDDEFYRLFIHWMPFETTLGHMTLGEYLKENDTLRFVTQVDQFRQISRVAAAQNMNIINAGYVHEAELLSKYSDVFPNVISEAVDPSGLAQTFEDLTLEEQEAAHRFLEIADSALRRFKCGTEIKKFQPREMAALYSTGSEGRFFRSLEQSKEMANPLWSSVLDNIAKRDTSGAGGVHAQLCFNYTNSLVQRLVGIRNERVIQKSVQMLYVQALLLGHHPLNSKEMAVLNEGLLTMIEWGVDSAEK